MTTTTLQSVKTAPAKPNKAIPTLRMLQILVPEATYHALAAAAHSRHMDPAEFAREVAGLEAWADRQGSLPAAAVGPLDPVTALRVANVPEADFTAQMESDTPPTVTDSVDGKLCDLICHLHAVRALIERSDASGADEDLSSALCIVYELIDAAVEIQNLN